jgi:hypothetical protein
VINPREAVILLLGNLNDRNVSKAEDRERLVWGKYKSVFEKYWL